MAKTHLENTNILVSTKYKGLDSHEGSICCLMQINIDHPNRKPVNTLQMMPELHLENTNKLIRKQVISK